MTSTHIKIPFGTSIQKALKIAKRKVIEPSTKFNQATFDFNGQFITVTRETCIDKLYKELKPLV